MLSGMRGRDGRPSGVARALGLLVALLLAGPLTVLLAQLLRSVMDLLL